MTDALRIATIIATIAVFALIVDSPRRSEFRLILWSYMLSLGGVAAASFSRIGTPPINAWVLPLALLTAVLGLVGLVQARGARIRAHRASAPRG